MVETSKSSFSSPFPSLPGVLGPLVPEEGFFSVTRVNPVVLAEETEVQCL